jgi:hypothetical protein
MDNEWRGFKRIQSETTVRENMGRMFWRVATEVMVKINSQPQQELHRFEPWISHP